MRYYLLSDNIDTKIGLRLAGIDGIVVNTEDEFKGAFDLAVKDKSIAILLITKKLWALAPECIEQQKINNSTPLIIKIPDRHGSIEADNYMLDYIKDAIGIKVR